jgi:hypothetical protein
MKKPPVEILGGWYIAYVNLPSRMNWRKCCRTGQGRYATGNSGVDGRRGEASVEKEREEVRCIPRYEPSVAYWIYPDRINIPPVPDAVKHR